MYFLRANKCIYYGYFFAFLICQAALASSYDDKKQKLAFSNAKDMLLWCNGMWCGQSPRAIKSLLKQGFPANKIKYFRGGMQTWLILGLTVVKP